MKHHFQKKAKYSALILASSLPFSAEVLADVEKKQIALESLSITDKNFSPSNQNVNPVKKELKQLDDLLNDETLQSAFLSVPFYKRLKNSSALIDAENSY